MKTCNQCKKKMEYSQIFQTKINVEIERYYIHFCTNPACRSLGLLQVPKEDIPEGIIK